MSLSRRLFQPFSPEPNFAATHKLETNERIYALSNHYTEYRLPLADLVAIRRWLERNRIGRHEKPGQCLFFKRSPANEQQGVIQLFNLLYIREADLKDALQKQQSHGKEELLDYDVRHLVPVYLGFGNLAEHPVYGQAAQR